MAWWTAKQTLQVVIGFWPFTVAWLIAVVASAIFAGQRHRLTMNRTVCALLPFLFSGAIILCGVAFNNRDGLRNLTSTVASGLLITLLLGQLALSVLLVWRLPGTRTFTVAVSVGGLWLSFWGAFVSAMSMTGIGFDRETVPSA